MWLPSLRTHWTVSPTLMVTVEGENEKFSAAMVTVLPATGAAVVVTAAVVVVARVVVVAAPVVVVVAPVVVVGASVVVVEDVVDSSSADVVVGAAAVEVLVVDAPEVAVVAVPPASPAHAASAKVKPSRDISERFIPSCTQAPSPRVRS